MIDRLVDSEADDRLDRLVNHLALDGPDKTLLQARLAHLRGDVVAAHEFVTAGLLDLPGHDSMLALAVEIGATLPPASAEILEQRERWASPVHGQSG